MAPIVFGQIVGTAGHLRGRDETTVQIMKRRREHAHLVLLRRGREGGKGVRIAGHGGQQVREGIGWRTLAFLLDGADAATARFAARCFDEAIAAAQPDPATRGAVVPALGLLSARALGELRRQALREVIAPCAAALPTGMT